MADYIHSLQCAECGHVNLTPHSHCDNCGAKLKGANAVRKKKSQYEEPHRVILFHNMIAVPLQGSMMLMGFGLVLFKYNGSARPIEMAVLGLFLLIAARGLWLMRRWGRTMQIAGSSYGLVSMLTMIIDFSPETWVSPLFALVYFPVHVFMLIWLYKYGNIFD